MSAFLAALALLAGTAAQPQEAGLPAASPAVIQTVQRYEVPRNIDTSFKAWMDYRSITNRSSAQWQLQQRAVTDEDGFRRMNGHYMVALGSYYAEHCGEVFLIELENGVRFTAVVGDVKSDAHTDSRNMYYPMSSGSGNVVEFIVDRDQLGRQARLMGDVSPLGMEGGVVSIVKIPAAVLENAVTRSI